MLQLFEFDDEPGFFSPVIYQQDGHARPGAFLALRDRTVFVWLKGRITRRPQTAVVPFKDVVSVQRGERPSQERDETLQCLEILAGEPWTLLAPSADFTRPHVFDKLAEWLGRSSSSPPPSPERCGVSMAPRLL